ncbi:MAG: amino acid permease [Candidatus Kapabacteria bacterium]|nr:amino acid permease [Candidatus Kapabacteria bacterium]
MKKSGLQRVLGKWNLTAIGVGAIIGAGIFVMTGIGAREHAGPALALSFVIAGIGCTFAALCYAEFASFLPVEGSAYAYSYATMGELFAWIIGWDLILEYAMASGAVAVGWSGYVGKFLNLFGLKLPMWLSVDSFTANTAIEKVAGNADKTSELLTHYSSLDLPTIFGYHFSFNLPAFLIIWLVTFILVKGIKEAANTNIIMVAIKLTVVLFIIVVGSMYIDIKNWTPFIPEKAMIVTQAGNSREAYGFMGILSGAAYIFFAYIGFDTVSTQAGEATNPKKDVPFGIIVSLLVCTVLYILVALVLTGMVKYSNIDVNAPIAYAFASQGLKFAVFIISIAAIAGLTSVTIVMLMGQSRIFYAMSKDGLLPKGIFGELHPKYKTPYKASLLTGFVVSLIAAFIPISKIAELVNIGTLLAFVMVCAAVMFMRYKEPSRERPFRAPALWIVAPLGIAFNLAMMFSLDEVNWLRLGIWLLIGGLVYFWYGRKHSVINMARK